MALFNVLWNYFFTTEKSDCTPLNRKLKIRITSKPTYLMFVRITKGPGLLLKWYRLKQEIFKILFENRAGCWFTPSNDIFGKEALESGTLIEKTGEPMPDINKTYIMAKECWTRDDLEDLVTSWVFDVGDVWMRPGMDARSAAAMTSANITDFQRFIKDFFSRDTDIKSHPGGIEIIGGFADGCIFWSNPLPEHVSSVMEHLKKLASDLDVEIEECINTC